MDKPVFNEIKQIGFVVDDIERVMDAWKEFGLTDWAGPMEVNGAGTENMTQRDEPIDYTTLVAINGELNVDIELIQPVTDNSAYAEFLREHGPGLHHLQIGNEEGFSEMITFLDQKTGGKTLLKGGPEFFQYRYYDTTDSLCCITEVLGDVSE